LARAQRARTRRLPSCRVHDSPDAFHPERRFVLRQVSCGKFVGVVTSRVVTSPVLVCASRASFGFVCLDSADCKLTRRSALSRQGACLHAYVCEYTQSFCGCGRWKTLVLLLSAVLRTPYPDPVCCVIFAVAIVAVGRCYPDWHSRAL
jgi:hypothetical protein